jgi:hypothetical protein
MHQSFMSFNGGELSPYLRHRLDVTKQPSGAEIFSNFLPLPFGGIRKRPGTIHLADLGDEPLRLESFHYSLGSQYILAFSASALRIFEAINEDQESELLEEISAEFSNPFALQFAQVNDVVFIADPGHYPRRLSFDGETWTLEDVPFENPPMLDENSDETWTLDVQYTDGSESISGWSSSGGAYKIGDRVVVSSVNYVCIKDHTPIASNNNPTGPNGATHWRRDTGDRSSLPGQVVELTSTQSLFKSTHVGSIFEIVMERPLDSYEVEVAAKNVDGVSPSIVVEGKWAFSSFGNWKGVFVIERSKDTGLTWESLRQYESNEDRNVASEGEEEGRVLLRVRWNSGNDAGANNPRGVLSVSDPYLRGLVKILSIDSDDPTTIATATTILSVGRVGKTETWSEGAFSDYQGYPRAVSVHERRLIFAGTTRKPVTLWMSKTDDLLDFQSGTAADDSIRATLATRNQDPIHWIASQRRLLVGTAGGEWVFGDDGAGEADSFITPTSMLARENTRYGSAPLPAIAMGDAVYFLERQGRRVREFAYQIEREGYAAADLTRLAEHITDQGIVQMAWQQNREPFLWAIRADGVLLSFAYNREEEIAAWSRHSTRGGEFSSLAILRNDEGDDDVYFIVKRGDNYHLEQLASGQHAIQEAGELDECFYVDSGITAGTTPSGSVHTINVPDHLQASTLCALANGRIYRNLIVNSGKISLPVSAAKVHLGLPIDSEHRVLPVDIPTETGLTLARVKRTHELAFSVVNSYGGVLFANGGSIPVEYPEAAQPALYDGWLTQTLPPGFETDLQFSFLHSDPCPFSVRAAVLRWQISEP